MKDLFQSIIGAIILYAILFVIPSIFISWQSFRDARESDRIIAEARAEYAHNQEVDA